jgi:hypothetical protein
MRIFNQPSKEELSTWPGIGTFYLAPTQVRLLNLPGACILRENEDVPALELE